MPSDDRTRFCRASLTTRPAPESCRPVTTPSTKTGQLNRLGEANVYGVVKPSCCGHAPKPTGGQATGSAERLRKDDQHLEAQLAGYELCAARLAVFEPPRHTGASSWSFG